jgi:3',5'-cyclic AMP phosphodiesterase CpdA
MYLSGALNRDGLQHYRLDAEGRLRNEAITKGASAYLVPGNHDLKVEAAGFKSVTQKGIFNDHQPVGPRG